jgi:hypothetical protein
MSYLPDAEKHPLWPAIYDLLKPAADYGDIDVHEDGDLVWIAFDGPTVFAAAVARPLGDEAELRIAAGSRFREWMPQLDAELTAWARANGAWRLTMRGRMGWARFAKRFGWVALGHDDAGRMLFQKEL